MSSHKDSIQDRLNRASEAKNVMLAKFKQAVDPNNPSTIEKRRQRESLVTARAERISQRRVARQEHERELARQAALAAEVAAEAMRAAAEQAAREAAEQAERQAALEAGAEGRARCSIRRTEGSKKAGTKGILIQVGALTAPRGATNVQKRRRPAQSGALILQLFP